MGMKAKGEVGRGRGKCKGKKGKGTDGEERGRKIEVEERGGRGGGWVEFATGGANKTLENGLLLLLLSAVICVQCA